MHFAVKRSACSASASIRTFSFPFCLCETFIVVDLFARIVVAAVYGSYAREFLHLAAYMQTRFRFIIHIVCKCVHRIIIFVTSFCLVLVFALFSVLCFWRGRCFCAAHLRAIVVPWKICKLKWKISRLGIPFAAGFAFAFLSNFSAISMQFSNRCSHVHGTELPPMKNCALIELDAIFSLYSVGCRARYIRSRFCWREAIFLHYYCYDGRYCCCSENGVHWKCTSDNWTVGQIQLGNQLSVSCFWAEFNFRWLSFIWDKIRHTIALGTLKESTGWRDTRILLKAHSSKTDHRPSDHFS